MATANLICRRKIALIGFGTIARDTWNRLKQSEQNTFEWAALLRAESAQRQHMPDDVLALSTIEDLQAWQPDLVIEAANQDVVRSSVPMLLANGINVIITSVGALADSTTYTSVVDAAVKGKSRLIIPAGAVASLDYLGALGDVTPVSVLYESRKPIAAWNQELIALGLDPAMLDHEVELFSGNANEAVLRYPKNLNVAASLALAGAGMKQTQVRVVVDPHTTANEHKITVHSPMGTLETRLLNSPSPGNPQTSWLVSQSVIHTVKRQFLPVLIGG